MMIAMSGPGVKYSTWTPSIGGTATYTMQTGTALKWPKWAYIYLRLIINSLGTGSTGQITGVPYAAADTAAPLTVGYFQNASTNPVSLSAYVNGSTINIMGLTAAATSITDPFTFFKNASEIYIAGFYRTAT